MECVFKLKREAEDGKPLPDSNLYLGDLADGNAFVGERLCVLEHGEGYEDRRMCIPILTMLGQGGRFYASRAQLDKAADYITTTLQGGQDLIVHCAAGIERSPLTVAWWYVKIGAFPDLKAAYGALKTVRPVVEDRQSWLEPAH